jgi:hypothetical protein
MVRAGNAAIAIFAICESEPGVEFARFMLSLLIQQSTSARGKVALS